MSKTIKLSDDIIKDAERYASIFSRSIPKQIEHWSKIGKIAEENPELSYNLIKDILIGLEEQKKDKLESYCFDDAH